MPSIVRAAKFNQMLKYLPATLDEIDGDYSNCSIRKINESTKQRLRLCAKN